MTTNRYILPSLLISGLLVLGACGSSDTGGDSGGTSLPTDDCNEAFAEAASVSEMEDTVEDLYPAAMVCTGLDDWSTAASEYPGVIDEELVVTFAENVCNFGVEYEPGLATADLCTELAGEEHPSPTTATTDPSTATTAGELVPADTYAKEKSGGVTTGCSSASPGAEAEAEPGCVYAVAFSGCAEGLTGERRPWPVEEEFAAEPKLVEIYRQAVIDCS